MGLGVVLALRRVTQTSRAYDFCMGKAESESKEADRMEARKRLRPSPSWTLRRAGRVLLSFRRRRVWERARQGEIPVHPLGQGKRRVWRFWLSGLAARWVPPKNKPCRAVQH